MKQTRFISTLFLTVLMIGLICMGGQAQAALVTELDFTSGSIALKFGSTTIASTNFTQNGQIIMGQYQPLPNIITPISLSVLGSNYNFSLFTSGPNPFPSGSTSGSTITADVNALSAGLAGPGLPAPPGLSLNIGGHAVGMFDTLTNAFTGLTWTHAFSGVSGLPGGWGNPANLSLQFTLNGTAQLAAVPLPAAMWLFGSGVALLVGVAKRNGLLSV